MVLVTIFIFYAIKKENQIVKKQKMTAAKKLMSAFLCLIMLLSVIPMTAFADGESGEDPDAVKAESITAVASRTLIENADGYFEAYSSETEEEKHFFVYDVDMTVVEVTVHYSNGTEKELDRLEIMSEVRFIDDQSAENPWGVGKHMVKAVYQGLETEFEVEIVENPVDHITASAKKTLIENVTGWERFEESDVDKYFYYDIFEAYPEVTVFYKDGTNKTITFDDFDSYLDFEDNQDEEHWKIGKNTATAIYMGVAAEFEVEIVENPVDHITVKAGNPIVYGVDGAFHYDTDETGATVRYFSYDLIESNSVITVYYKDNRTEDVLLGTYGTKIVSGQYYAADGREIGTKTFTVEYMGHKADVEIEMVDNDFESVEISGNENLAITITKKGGEKTEFALAEISSLLVIPDFNMISAQFITTSGDEIFADIFYGDLVDMSDISVEIYGIRSNTLKSNAWIKMNFITPYIQSSYRGLCSTLGETVLFDGKITADNIDNIIYMAVNTILPIMYQENDNVVYDLSGEAEDEEFVEFDPETLKSIVSKLFDITDADFTASKYYNSEIGEFEFPMSDFYYFSTVINSVFRFDGGKWNIDAAYLDIKKEDLEFIKDSNLHNAETIKKLIKVTKENIQNMRMTEIVLDENLIIKEITDNDILVGDINLDGRINALDCIILERYLAGWYDLSDFIDDENISDILDGEMYDGFVNDIKDILNSILVYLVDTDGNGKVTDWDHIMLSRYLAGWDVELSRNVA